MIKVNVISGFLGAGKTTLIKHLAMALSAAGEKIAILENEFGQVGIDGRMLEMEGLSVYEIASGCICCTLKSNFTETLITITDKLAPDRILIEPSGIFIPSELRDIFKNPQISSRLTLCSLLTVIDCSSFIKQRHRYGYFFEKQIVFSDKLLLNKTEDICSETIRDIVEQLKKINRNAEIVLGEWAQMHESDFLKILSIDQNPSLVHEFPQSCMTLPREPEIFENHGGYGFAAYSLYPEGRFSKTMLDEKLSSLADGELGTIVRAKGFVMGEEGMLDFSYVEGKYTIEHREQQTAASICVIGENLNNDGISVLFKT